MKPTWKKYLLYGSTIVIGGILLFVLEETIRLNNTGFATKTLWDWMELLVIPLVLAIGAFYLERSERAVDRKTAEDRAKLERELATDRQQDAALQAYFDRMTELLLKENLLESQDEKVLNVARVRTLTALRGLNSARNGIVMRFLHDIGIARKTNSKLFVNANLEGADLEHVDLLEINLQGANLGGANLEGALLKDALLRYANLEGAIVSNDQLATAKSLERTTMPDGTKHK
jgi:hypothetical protein